MKLKNTILAGLCAMTLPMIAQTQLNPITEAVMEVYAEELLKAPNDYNILLARAYEYYSVGEYLRALDDVTAALKYTTRDDMEILVDEYLLRANIYEKRNEYQLALNDLTEALRLNPSSEICRLQIANVYMHLENYDAAKNEYQILLRQNSLNHEAIAGLAKIAVHQKNFGVARELVNKLISLYPAQSTVYVTRGDVLNMMGEHNAAAHDYLTAVTLDTENPEAVQKLVDMSNINYREVILSLDDAIEKAPQSGTLLYLRSIIKLDKSDYKNALVDINMLIDNNIYNTDGICYDCANANFHLGRYDKGLPAINSSIMVNPTVGMYYVLKSKILVAKNDLKNALNIINIGLDSNPNNVDILNQKAMILVAMKDYKNALTLLNESILNDSERTYSYMLRAWVKKAFLKDREGSELDYNRVLKTESNENEIYRAFALNGLGRDAEAKSLIEYALEKSNASGGEKLYYAAALYAMCGDVEKGLYYLEGSLANGYGSYYNLMYNDEAGISLKSLRSLPAFKLLMEKYNLNFN